MKKTKLLSSLLLVLTLITQSCNSQGDKTDNDPEPPIDKSSTIKVMSYNIHRGNPPSKNASYRDLKAIAYVIKIEKPDFVALSEVDNKTKRSGVTVNQAKELGRLTGMHYYFTKAMDYQGGEYGDAVLSKLPILDSTRYELPTTDNSFEPRSIAMITVEKDGQKFHFGSTHFDHTSNGANRELQVKATNKIIKKLSYPLILAGDWNSKPDSEPIKILKQTLTPTCSKCPLTFPAIKPNRTLDYVMYRPKQKFELKSLKTVNETYASDHLPLVVELKLNN